MAQKEDNSKILWAANWSKDNSYFAIGGVDNKIRLFSGKSFELLSTIENSTSIQRMSWHPHFNILAVAATGNGSKIIDVEKDSTTYLQGDNNYGGRAIAWNSTGDLLAYADYEGEITIWNKEGELIRTIKKGNTISNVAIDWHPSKDEFVVLSDSVRIYNSDGELLNQFEHRKKNVLLLCVQWHPSGDFFAIGDYGDTENDYKPLLQFWKPKGHLIKEIAISKAEYRNLSWSADGKKLATASDALRIWNRNGKLLAEGLSEDYLWGVDWSPNGQFIVTSSTNGHIKIWNNKAKVIKELTY
ncbi:WD40 repeat domain-containing protein [Anditalea andensis]|nr:hypothetical protein [Anditalea andensis]